MSIVQCPHCKTGNRLGKRWCKKCMTELPQVEDVIKPKKINKIVKKETEDLFEEVKDQSELTTED